MAKPILIPKSRIIQRPIYRILSMMLSPRVLFYPLCNLLLLRRRNVELEVDNISILDNIGLSLLSELSSSFDRTQ